MKLQLDAVTFAPHELDGNIQARMRLGTQEIVTSWPKSQDLGIARMVDQLAVRVVDVTLARTDAGREIQATLSLADRPVLVSWVVEEDDGELGWVFEKLLKDVGDGFVRQLRALMALQEDDDETSDDETDVNEFAAEGTDVDEMELDPAAMLGDEELADAS